MRSLLTFVTASILAMAFGTGEARAQSSAQQRTVSVIATTQDGLPAETLAPEDVIVREDDIAREILKVTRATDPVDITLLVDNSIAATRAIQDMRLGLEKFVETFAGPHSITLVTVADRPTVQVRSTTSKAQLLRGVKRLFAQPDAGAYLIEGIVEVAKSLAKAEPRRSAILAITSFGVEFSDRGFQFALDELARSGATLHVIELQDTERADQSNQNVRDRNIVIDRGTRETGGVRELLVANMSLTDALQKIGRIITTQYDVVYLRPTTLIPPSRIEVTSARPTLKVQGNVLQATRAAR